jgi:hypothetical protein
VCIYRRRDGTVRDGDLASVIDELLAGTMTPAVANSKIGEIRKRLDVVEATMRAARTIQKVSRR